MKICGPMSKQSLLPIKLSENLQPLTFSVNELWKMIILSYLILYVYNTITDKTIHRQLIN